MSARHYTIALSLLAALAHPSAHAQSPATKTLAEQGWYWQSRGDYKRASEVWEKLLLASPNNPDALYGMAAAALDAKDTGKARSYLDRLRQAAPNNRLIPLLEQDIYLSQPGPAQDLDKARSLAASRQMDEAIAQYDRVLQGRKPQGSLALEYYNYLGYSTGGVERAIRGLQDVLRTAPNNTTYQLALAKHLVRSLEHRAEGIAMLQRLSTRPEVGSEATEGWRSALTWIGPPAPEYRPSFEAYLKANPNDAEIRALLAKGGSAASTQAGARQGAKAAQPWRQDPVLARAFKALDSGDLDAAEQGFRAKLKTSPNNADALGGLGVVRMQQNDYIQAEQLLARAARANAQWNKTLNATRYWKLVNDASAALSNEDLTTARRAAESAIRLDGRTAAAHNLLGQIQAESGQLDKAAQTFTQVLKRDRQNVDALSGLIGVMAQRGQPEQALQLIAKLTPEQRAEIGNVGRLRAAVAAGKAKAAQQRGDDAGAQMALEDAIRDDPNNPWIRFDLARLYMKKGATTEARGLVDGLLTSHPDMPDALYASSLLSMEMGDSEKAYATLLRIPDSKRTPEMAALEQRLWVQAQAAQASRLARQGRTPEAHRLLSSLETTAGQDPSLLGAVASAYVDTGDAGRGLSLMRRQMEQSARPDADLLLPYAGLLLKTGQDVEAAGVLRSLQNQRLNTAQQQSFDDLIYLYTVRQADLLRERGDLVAAYDTLAPALAQRPNDSAAVGALARMYAAGGDYDKSLDYYKRLLKQDPDNADLQMGAAMVATQLRDYTFAEEAINHALAIAPDNPDILANAARLYRARGKTSKAAELFTAAIAAEDRQLAAASPTIAAAPANDGAPDNPFVGLPGQRTRSTLPRQALADILDEPAIDPAPAQYAQNQPLAPLPDSRSRPSLTAYPAPAPVIPAPTPPAPVAAVATAQPIAVPRETTLQQPITGPAAGTGITMPPVAPVARNAEPLRLPYPQAASVRSMEGAAAPSGASSQQAPLMLGLKTANQPSTLRDELAALREANNPEVRLGGFGRSNNGEQGMSKITEVQAPLEVRLPAGDGMLSLRATYVNLDAGTLDNDYYAHSRFGGGPAVAYDLAIANPPPGGWASMSPTDRDAYFRNQIDNAGPSGKQRDSGVGLSVGYETRGLRVDLGTTPLGFRRTNMVGGIQFDGMFNEQTRTWYNINLSRRAVTDSLLSFAGAHDSRTGQTWGAVTATGLQFQVGQDGDRFGVYGYGGWHALRGHHVESNWRADAGAGVYWHLLRDTDQRLTAGLNLGTTFYDKNQRFFTYGHGGYFSPQQMYSLSLPLTWAQRSGRLSYKLQGAIGVQRFKEDAADYFPTDAAMQAQAEAAANLIRQMGISGATATYTGQTKTGLGYNLLAAAEYQLGGNWVLGSSLAFNNAKDYRQWAGGLYLRYMLYPSSQALDLPVNPYRGPYGN